MKRLTYINKTVLIDDSLAETMLEYAGALAGRVMSEPVRFTAIDHEGEQETIAFLLGPASQIMYEDSTTPFTAPDNSDVVASMRRRIAELSRM